MPKFYITQYKHSSIVMHIARIENHGFFMY